ncbi:hypothetical protein [Desulfofundulus sp.]|uniref:hypothetical protein n=1 Tax=Desulfofundulus sp. TaxID=2282750 RepID=UPI003C72E2E0
MVIPFPTPEDRAAVQTAVNVFLWTQRPQTRLLMLEAAREVLERYNISRLHISDYTVALDRDGFVAITARKILANDQRTCPGCGADIYAWPGDVRILSIQEGCRRDVVTYGCRCGRVFAKIEPV